MPPFPTFMLDWVLIGQHDKGIEGEKCPYARCQYIPTLFLELNSVSTDTRHIKHKGGAGVLECCFCGRRKLCEGVGLNDALAADAHVQ
eukprot:COSAG02_NODE_6300_length_3669_cov_2.392437_2_plen_88_part_00